MNQNEIYEAVIIEGTTVSCGDMNFFQDAVTMKMIIQRYVQSDRLQYNVDEEEYYFEHMTLEIELDRFEDAYAVFTALAGDDCVVRIIAPELGE